MLFVSIVLLSLLWTCYGSSCSEDQCVDNGFRSGLKGDNIIYDYKNLRSKLGLSDEVEEPKYDKEMALFALKHSYASYAPKKDLEDWSCGCCQQDEISSFETTLVVDDGSQQAYLGVATYNDNPMIVLSFRGTHNICGWICYDFHFNELKYKGVDDATVHEGFYKVWHKSLLPEQSYLNYKGKFLPDIEKLLKEYSGDKCKILVTGHSLGAAIAYVASLTIADYLLDNEKDIQCEFSVFTFGAPRWANSVLADYFNKHSKIYQHWRLVNGYDVVPAVPTIQFFNFYHTTTHVWYETASPNSAIYIGSSQDGENNEHGYDLVDCLDHPFSCIFNHITYLGYLNINTGMCREVSLSNLELAYNQTMMNREKFSKSGYAIIPPEKNIFWNTMCGQICT